MRRLFAAIAIIVTLLAPAVMPAFAQTGTTDPQGTIRTEIPIPGEPIERVGNVVRGTVSSLGEYIGSIYTFLLSIVGVVAGVSMVYGGFLWMTSGGSGDRAKAGKKRISDALIGLVLAFAAYVILNTINPDLVKFRPLTIPTVKTETLNYDKILGGTGGLGTPCKTDNDCAKPLTCMVVKEAPLEKGLRYFGTAIGVAISLPAAGGGSAVAGGKLLFNGAKIALKYVGKSFIAAPVTTTIAGGAAGYVAWSEASKLGYVGVCAQEADHEVPKGESCSKDSHCKVGLRCLKDPNIQNICVDCGYCSDGSNGSFCQPNSTDQCGAGTTCVQAADGVWFCSNGAQGSGCAGDSDCHDPGTVCRKDTSFSAGHCAAAQQGGTGASCKTDADCNQGGDAQGLSNGCLIPGGYSDCNGASSGHPCVCHSKNQSKNGEGAPCYDPRDCASNRCKADGKVLTSNETYVHTLGACIP